MLTAPDSTGGISSTYHGEEVWEARVAPATGKERNTIRLPLFPIACWRLDHIRFDFDSSFIRPDAKREMDLLAKLIQRHPKAPISIFAHADPVGEEEYNKQLSGRRAKAIYALLTRDIKKWDELHQLPLLGDDWGLRSIQTMLDALGYPPGPIDGVTGPATQNALRAFQSSANLEQTGGAGPGTRAALFSEYMDLICGPAFRLAPADFLGGGSDPMGRGDYQGCSEFNALLRFSATQSALFEDPDRKADRDEANTPNRRVVVFLFRPGATIDVNRWPCPRASEGVAGCKRRFWSDHAFRRAPGQAARKYEETRDTFACRYYDRIAGKSPCESTRPKPKTWIRFLVLDARDGLPVPEVELIVRTASGQQTIALTDALGGVVLEDIEHGPVEVSSGEGMETQTASPLTFVGLGPHEPVPPPVMISGLPVGRLLPLDDIRPSRRRHISILAADPDDPAPRKFVDVERDQSIPVGATGRDTKPFKKEGLQPEQVHMIRVTPLESFQFSLKDEHGFPIPKARYEITIEDMPPQSGELDLDGRGFVYNPPEGRFEIRYLDLDDVKAKSVAGQIRKACASGDYQTIYRNLLYSPLLLRQADLAYQMYFNNLSGKGMAEDIQDAIKDENLLLGMQALMTLGNMETRMPIRFARREISAEL